MPSPVRSLQMLQNANLRLTNSPKFKLVVGGVVGKTACYILAKCCTANFAKGHSTRARKSQFARSPELKRCITTDVGLRTQMSFGKLRRRSARNLTSKLKCRSSSILASFTAVKSWTKVKRNFDLEGLGWVGECRRDHIWNVPGAQVV